MVVQHSWHSGFIAAVKLVRMSTALHISSIYGTDEISEKMCQYLYFETFSIFWFSNFLGAVGFLIPQNVK